MVLLSQLTCTVIAPQASTGWLGLKRHYKQTTAVLFVLLLAEDSSHSATCLQTFKVAALLKGSSRTGPV